MKRKINSKRLNNRLWRIKRKIRPRRLLSFLYGIKRTYISRSFKRNTAIEVNNTKLWKKKADDCNWAEACAHALQVGTFLTVNLIK